MTNAIKAMLFAATLTLTASSHAAVSAFECKSSDGMAAASYDGKTIRVELNGAVLGEGEVNDYSISRTSLRIPDLASHVFSFTDRTGVERKVAISTIIQSSMRVGGDIDTGVFDSASIVYEEANWLGFGGKYFEMEQCELTIAE